MSVHVHDRIHYTARNTQKRPLYTHCVTQNTEVRTQVKSTVPTDCLQLSTSTGCAFIL